MVSCTEIKLLTKQAEERERQKVIAYVNKIKEETREYCSAVVSKQLQDAANIPSHKMIIYTRTPDGRGMANVCEKDGDNKDTYSASGKNIHIETLVEFIREHGFEVTNELGSYKYSARTHYPAQVITIKW